MLGLKKMTVAKKISLVSISALCGMLIIIVISLAFFEKISEISRITKIGNEYAIYYYKASMAFQGFTQTKNPDDMNAFVEFVNQMNRKNGSLGRINRLYQEYHNNGDILKAYEKQYGHSQEYKKEILDSLQLIKALKGKPLLAQFLGNCEKANGLSTEWLELGRQYSTAGDAEKARIQSRMTADSQQLLALLNEFNVILESITAFFKSIVTKLFVGIAFFMMIVLSTVTVLVVKSIIKPLQATVAFAKSLSTGDLTQKIVNSSKDELGEMSEALNQMGHILGQMLKEIMAGTQGLSSAATQLSAISNQMTKDTKDTSEKASDVSVATDKMSDSMRIAASAMEEGINNSGIMASAAEEMSSTINEISKNAEKARAISANANEKTSQTTIRMNELGQAADGIGKVIETITEISEQVNLLALNATIEAARAGEAGKGFAVVANEIKELARQTAAATQDIKQKIETIQNTTKTTIAQNTEISLVIVEVNDVIVGIATAIEEQSYATREIAANINKTSKGLEEVGGHIAGTSQTAADINNVITEVNQSAAQIAESSHQVNLSAEDLSALAEKLSGMVARFQL